MTATTVTDKLHDTRRTGRFADVTFRGVARIAALASPVILTLIFVLLAVQSAETWRTFGIVEFVTGTTWDPVAAVYGALPYVVGTLLTSLFAILIAAPIGILTAIFLAEMASPRVATPLSFLIELLAAIPSVVIGLWGVFVMAPILRDTIESWIADTFGWIPFLSGPTFGIGLFAASVILAIMILPTIVAISRDVIKAVPDSQREGMVALGATRWETIRIAVIPAARSGMIGAVILGLGRALGETMAVTMVIGNAQAIPTRLFDQAQTIASKIATTFNEASQGIQISSLIALGLVLLVITVGLNMAARLLVWRVAGPVPAE